MAEFVHTDAEVIKPEPSVAPAAPLEYDKVEPGGNGGGGNMTEARIARLESDVEHIKNDIGDIKQDLREIKTDAKNDFRLLFGALIFVALGLAGIMAKGFGWL